MNVIVGVRVTVGEGVRVGVWVSVGVKIGVFVGVLVGVLVEVGVLVGVFVIVAVGVEACHVDGGTVTTIATLTKTVRALSAVMGSAGVSALERERNGTIFGTIGR